MELAVGLLAGVTVWTVFARLIRRRDVLIRARLAYLAPQSLQLIRRKPSERSLLSRIGKRVPGDRLPTVRALSSSGMESADPDAVAGARVLLSLIGAVAGLVLPLSPLLALVLGAVGYRLPNVLLRIKARARRDEAAQSIPDVADLLAVCTQAGLNLPLALERVADNTPGVLGEELNRALRRIGLGVPRAEALAELAERNDLEEISGLVNTVIAAEKFGTKVADRLADFAAQVRSDRRLKAEEQARRAPIKILFPLVFLILPAFVLLTIVPLLLGTFASLGF